MSLIKVYWILLWQKEGRDLVIWGEKQTRGEDEPILPNTWTVMRGDSEKLKSIFHKELWGLRAQTVLLCSPAHVPIK